MFNSKEEYEVYLTPPLTQKTVSEYNYLVKTSYILGYSHTMLKLVKIK